MLIHFVPFALFAYLSVYVFVCLLCELYFVCDLLDEVMLCKYLYINIYLFVCLK
jgi:hypothetical protein